MHYMKNIAKNFVTNTFKKTLEQVKDAKGLRGGFAYIKDIAVWKKRYQIAENSKVFIANGNKEYLKKCLRKRGWVENMDPNSVCFDLKWTLKPKKHVDFNAITKNQLVNHFPKASLSITTKVGLMHNLKKLIWFKSVDI